MPGNRRNPYRVRITVGWTKDPVTGKSKQRYATVGYYPTYKDASIALVRYHQNPLSLESGVTFAEVYRRWSEERYETAGESLIRSYTAAFKAVPMLHEIPFKDLRRNHLQNAVDNCGKNYPTLKNIKLLISLLFQYAIQNDLVEKDYAQYIDITRHKPDIDEQSSIHTDIKPDEIAALWSHTEDQTARQTLMLIYSGLRISEFCGLSEGDVDLDARIVTVRKSKTASGRRRVPIAMKTLPFWREHRFPQNTPASSDVRKAALSYRNRMKDLQAYGLEEHLPHDTRHTCATLLFNAGTDSYVTKRILGHAESDLTDNVYTHLSDEVLRNAIDKL